MNKFSLFFIIIVIFLLTGCEDKEKIRENARTTAIEFIKEEEGREMVVTDYEFTSAIGGGAITVFGYYKDNKKEKVYVTVLYDNEDEGYRVGPWGS